MSAMTPERRRQLLAASRLGLSVMAGGAAHFYNADQPRAEDGRWSSTAGQGGLTAATAGETDVLRAGRKDVPAALAASCRNWAEGLPPEGKGALMKFTTGEHAGEFNKPLRGDPDPDHLPPQLHREASALDAAIRSFPPHPPVTSWRGINASTHDRLEEIEAGFKAALAAGGVVTMNGFTTSTLDPGLAAQDGGIVLEIKSSQGAYLGNTDRFPEDLAVMHTHGQQFKVTGVHEVTYGDTQSGWTQRRRTYTLEALPVSPPPFPPPPAPPAVKEDAVHRLAHRVRDWLLTSPDAAEHSADFYDPDQPRNRGRFASKEEVGEAGRAALDLYDRAGHPDTKDEHIREAVRNLNSLSKAQARKTAEAMGMSVPKSHAKHQMIDGMASRMLDRHGAAVRARLVYRPSAPPPPAGGDKKGPAGTGDGKHGVKLPKNPKKLNIAEANTALSEMGYKVGADRYSLKDKTSYTELTHPDGTTKTYDSDGIKKLVYGGVRAAPAQTPQPPASVEALKKRLADAEAKVASSRAKVDSLKAKTPKAQTPKAQTPEAGGGAAAITALYERAGRPGVAPAEIDRAFAGSGLESLPKSRLRELARKLDVAPGKLSSAALVLRMKSQVSNRAGTHERVKDAGAPGLPKSAQAGGNPHAAASARIEEAVAKAAKDIQKGNGKTGGNAGPGDYDEGAVHKVFDEVRAGLKSKKDLAGFLAHHYGQDEATRRRLESLPKKALDRRFHEATRGRIGTLMRAMV